MEGVASSTVIVYAFLAGIVPALVWLFFLLREDAKNPEPKRLVAITFLGGMAAVLMALPVEHFACANLGPAGGCDVSDITASSTKAVLLAWAVIEEALKYGVTTALILWRKDVDEPIDYVVYMITAALGFAALENALFLIGPFSGGNIAGGLLTDNLRFVGSTLLHVLASSVIGFALAFSYHREETHGEHAISSFIVIGGLILAVALHAVFNFLIISSGGSATLEAFLTVWTGIIVFFALFEILKAYEKRQLSP
jgi:RsiW-degrading membrane proteinase PrsW (M82 family)